MIALILMPQVSLAADDHIAEAITHTKQAIDHGKMGHANVLTTHSKAALAHAQTGKNAKANPHTDEAIKQLFQLACDVTTASSLFGFSYSARKWVLDIGVVHSPLGFPSLVA
jgi:hypothetical protein